MTISTLTQDSIIEFAHRIEADEAKATSSRLKVFMQQCEITDVGSLKASCKDASAYARQQGDTVAESRISEVRQLYGAVRFCNLIITDCGGYHKAVKASREALKSAGIKYDGSKVLSEAEREAKAESRIMSKANKELAAEFDWSQPDAASHYQDALIDKANSIRLMQQAEAEAKAESKVAELAEDLISKYGLLVAGKIAYRIIAIGNAMVERYESAIEAETETETETVAIAA